MKFAILAVATVATAIYCYTGHQAVKRAVDKIESNTQRIERLECQLSTTPEELCQ